MASKNYKVFELGTKKVLVSYNTLIAVFDKVKSELVTTNTFYSTTTSKHLNMFKKECLPQSTVIVDSLDNVGVTFTPESVTL
jgi:hypothetical protein